jgi:hypothetical protein
VPAPLKVPGRITANRHLKVWARRIAVDRRIAQ